MNSKWSGVILLTPNGDVIAMHRDNTANIRDPGCYGIFGGAAEGDETPLETAIREIHEETNLSVPAADFEFFKLYEQERDNLSVPAQLSIFVLKDINPNTLKIYEGQGIKILKDASDPNIAPDIKIAFEDWFAENPR